jgi:hypothetical protein
MSALCDGTKLAIVKRQDGAFQILLSGGDISQLHGVWSGCE